MLVFSRLNSISIIPILDSSAELRYNLFCCECSCKIMKKSFADLSEMIGSSCHVVNFYYEACGVIPAGKIYFLSLIFDPDLHDFIRETFSAEELGIIACIGLNLKQIEYYKNGNKALELINAYKFDNMSQCNSGKSSSNWVEAFLQNLSTPTLLMKLEDCLKMLLNMALNQAKPFIHECEMFSKPLLQT